MLGGSSGQKYGLIVEAFGVIQELVVKELPGFLANLNGLGGVSISNEGEIMLLLDIDALIASRYSGQQAA